MNYKIHELQKKRKFQSQICSKVGCFSGEEMSGTCSDREIMIKESCRREGAWRL
jgi:hypothetical protein